MDYTQEEAELINALEKRPMSTWTDDEGRQYATLTGQIWGEGNLA